MDAETRTNELPCSAVKRHCLVSLALALAFAAAVLAVAPSAASAAQCPADTPSLPLNTSVDIPFDCAVTGTPTVTDPPDLGTATVQSGSGRPVIVRYVPHQDVRGIDRFGWSDGDETYAEQYVVVGAALKLTCDAVSRLYQQPGPFLAHDGQDLEILGRCSNRVYGDALSLEVTSPPAHGGATFVAENPGPGYLRYRPSPGYTGPDVLQARVVSPVPGRTSAAFEIAIAVKAPNRPPVCPPVALTIVQANGYQHFPSLCSDPDGDPLSYGLVRMPASGEAFFGPDLVMTYRPRLGWTGSDTVQVVVGDGFAETRVDVPVEVRGEEPPPVSPPPVSPPPPSLPAPPEGFVPARGADLGGDAVVWGPLGGIRLGRRALPVVAAGCRVACTVSARLRLFAKRHRRLALPAQTIELPAGRRRVVRMKLTGAALSALRDRKRARAELTLVVTPAGGATTRDTLDLRVGLPAAEPRR